MLRFFHKPSVSQPLLGCALQRVKLLGLLLLLSLFVACAAQTPDKQNAFKDGDLIFHISKSTQSQAIQLATGSKYSHVGIIFYHNNKPMVLEAISTVRYTPLQQWIQRGINRHYVVKRLINADTQLTAEKISELRKHAQQHLNKPYDFYFEWTDDKLYCSELAWKAYQQTLGVEIGELKPLRSYNISHPLVMLKLFERYGTKIPLDSKMISPAAMFDSPLLSTVASNSP